MNSNLLNQSRGKYYLNGNYLVFYDYYGETQYKRCLRINEDLIADFPDSIDLKITNKCNHGCPYCHENSVPNGNSFNFDHTIEVLKQLPRVAIEIAIGGGNVLEIPDDTLKLIDWCNDYGFKTRITINQKDVDKFIVKTPKDVKLKKGEKDVDAVIPNDNVIIQNIGTRVGGIGISLEPSLLPDLDTTPNYRLNIYFGGSEDVKKLSEKYILTSALRGSNIVFHIIAGLFPINKLKTLLDRRYLKNINNLLILGYKQFGRAACTDLPESLPEFEKVVKEFITNSRNNYIDRFNIAFDNLALEQLHMKDFITEDDWDHLYLGKEGSCSMYIDAVNETYARSSTSTNRTSWKDIGLLDYFKSLRNENNN